MNRNLKNHVAFTLLAQFIAETPINKIEDDCTYAMVQNAQEFTKTIEQTCPEVMAEMRPYQNEDGSLNGYGQSLAMIKFNAEQNGSAINFAKVFHKSSVGYNLAALYNLVPALQKQFDEARITQLSAEGKQQLLRAKELIEFLLTCPVMETTTATEEVNEQPEVSLETVTDTEME